MKGGTQLIDLQKSGMFGDFCDLNFLGCLFVLNMFERLLEMDVKHRCLWL